MNHAPFSSPQGMVRFIKGTMARGKDLMMGIEGQPGTGKSTTGSVIAKNIKPGFNMQRDSIKDFDHLLQSLYECRSGELYVVDEAVNIFYNQDWASWEAKGLSKIIRQMRIMHGCWILNQPDFDGLHPYVRESRIPLRIYHPPVYDSGGMSNGPSQVYWKNEYFSWEEQRVVKRWQCVIQEFSVPCMDGDAAWAGYEDDKVANFRRLVDDLRKRRASEQTKEVRAMARAKKRAPKASAATSPPLLRRGGPP